MDKQAGNPKAGIKQDARTKYISKIKQEPKTKIMTVVSILVDAEPSATLYGLTSSWMPDNFTAWSASTSVLKR